MGKSLEITTMAFLVYFVSLALIQSCVTEKIPFGQNDVSDAEAVFMCYGMV